MKTTEKQTRFFHYGCWNRDNCSKTEHKYDYRVAILDELEKTAASYEFGVIAGDNIYPHVQIEGQTKEKKYYKETLNYALSKLRNIQSKLKQQPGRLFTALGNHDVANKSVAQYELGNGSLYMPKNNYVEVVDNIRLIVIDTNLLTETLPSIYTDKSMLQMHSNRSNHSNSSKRSSFNVTTTDGLLEWLRRALNEPYSGTTVVVGHEPIISCKTKMKDGEPVIKKSSLYQYEKLLDILTSTPRVIYMCADVHSFQAWNIQWKGATLPMIVAGTGGAKPDDPPLGCKGEYIYQSTKMILLSAESPYGYCDVACDASHMRISYRPLLGCSTTNAVDLQWNFNASSGMTLLTLPLSMGSTIPSCPVKKIEPVLCALNRTDLTGDVLQGGVSSVSKTDKILYNGKKYVIRVDKTDRRRRYIQTKTGFVPISVVRKALLS